MPETPQKQLLIIGLGGLGSSLALAFNAPGWRKLACSRNPEARRWALASGATAEVAADPATLIGRADLTVMCLPIPANIEYLHRYAALWKPGAAVTDIGSTKRSTMRAAAEALADTQVEFIGSHPMAGTEKSGFRAAQAGLFDGADVFLCGDRQSEAAKTIEFFWNSVGMDAIWIDPAKHDKLVAHTSHAPHVLSSALTSGVLGVGDRREHFAGCAGGFRDTSRIASSDPGMWREVIEDNRDEVLSALKDFSDAFDRMRAMIENRDFDGFETAFAHGRELREEWLEYMAEKNAVKDKKSCKM